jgi:hypothetical protein
MAFLSEKLISASGGATEETDPDFNLVTQLYQFDGTNGAQNNTFLDSSSNSFSVTRSGSATQGTFSPFSSEEGKWSVSFDGTDDYLSIPTSDDFAFGTGDFTIEMWVFRTTTGMNFTYEGRKGGNANRILIYFNTSNQLVVSAGGTKTDSETFPTGEWVHIALVRSGTTGYLFKNGDQRQTWTIASDYSFLKPDDYLYIGTTNNLNNYWFGGFISNLRVLKGTALYTGSSYTVPTAPLTAVTNTKLLIGCSNRFRDKSTSAHTITPVSTPKIQPLSPFAPSAAYDPAVNGGSGYFSATADYASIAASSDFDVLSNGTFTIDFWFYRTDALGLYADYVGIFNGVSSGVLLYQYSTGFHVYINGSTVFNVTHPALNQWVHVALTRDGTTLRLALNGVLQASSTASLGTSNYPLNVAGDSTGRAGLQGYISDVRVVKGTRVYASNFTPPTAPSTAITNTEALLSFTNAAMFDQTGKTNIETVGNAQLNTSIKKFGSASAKFDESGDYLIVRNAPLLGGGDFTIEGFVYFNSSPTDGQGLFVYDSQSLGNRAGYGPALGTYAHAPYDGKWHSYYGTQATPGTGTQGNSEATPSATTWIHFAFVRTSGVIKIFIGGSQIGSDIAWTGNYIANDVLTIAGYYSTSYLLNGYIDSYRVTLKARYTSNFTPPSEEFPNR